MPEAIGALVGLTPQGRLPEVADMADAVVLLASDAARFITGAGLPVDGGLGMSGKEPRARGHDSW